MSEMPESSCRQMESLLANMKNEFAFLVGFFRQYLVSGERRNEGENSE